jgi:hypothetical protein
VTTVDGAWTAIELETFLDQTRVPIRLACETPAGGLWMLSLWFRPEGHRLCCATARSAELVEYVAHSDHVAFEISTNRPPYMGVRGNGTVTVGPDEDKELLGSLIDRYLGDRDSELASWLLSADRSEVRIEITPERLYTWDYSDRMDGVEPVDQPPTSPTDSTGE